MDEATQPPRRKSLFKEMLPFFVCAHCAHHLLTALPAPMLPFIQNSFNLSDTSAGFVISAFTLAYGFGQLPAGWLADRIGTRTMITIGIVGVAVAGLLVGLSQSYVMLLACLALMGVAGGGYHPAATPLVSESVEPERRPRALGFHLIGGSVSLFLAPLIAAAIAAAWGWRGSFLGLAVPTAIFGIVFYFFLRRRAGGGQTREAKAQFQEAPPAPGYKRRLTAYMIMTVLTGGVIISTVYLLPLYIHNFFGASEAVSARWLSVVWIAGLWAGPVGGWLAERFGKIPVILVTTVYLAACILVLRWAPYGWAMGTVFLLLGIGMYIRMPVAEAYVMSQTTPRNRGTIFGIFYFTMQEAGAVFTPIIGFLFDTVGYQNAFIISAAWVAVVTVAAVPFLWGKAE